MTTPVQDEQLRIYILELLTALQDVLSALGVAERQLCTSQEQFDEFDCVQVARAAIAKATGESE